MRYFGKRPELKYLAIRKPGDAHYTWFEKTENFGLGHAPAGCEEIRYRATGNSVTRQDGAMAEIYVVVSGEKMTIEQIKDNRQRAYLRLERLKRGGDYEQRADAYEDAFDLLADALNGALRLLESPEVPI